MIVGIAGFRQTGKTTLGNLLAEAYQLDHVSFAEPIRAFIAGHILHCSLEELEREKETPIAWLEGLTPRYLMQTLGTEWGRALIDQELWVRLAVRRASIALGAVISDVRFPNESKAIRDMGGVIVRVHRAGHESSDGHASETPLPDSLVDFEVENNGSPAQMLAKVATCLTDHIRVYREAVARHLADPATDADVAQYAAPGVPQSAIAGD